MPSADPADRTVDVMLARPTASTTPAGAVSLNSGCYCRTLDAAMLHESLTGDPHSGETMARLLAGRPTLFSPTAVFLGQEAYQQLVAGIACLERVVRTPGYQAAALRQAPPIAAHDFGPLGVFVSYDFHLAADGPRLIEINSNAGGALLSAALARAQRNCCQAMTGAPLPGNESVHAEQLFLEMFHDEWHRQRRVGAPGSIAIVDDDPASQYLAPEFQLFQRLFERAGIASRIVDANTLQWREGRLWHETLPIDLVYNRLTDFHLSEPRHRALRDAYEAGAIVLTPHPRTHALHADKRNLIGMSHGPNLRQWGVAEADIELLLRLVPETRLVSPDNAGALWARRRALFFKPTAGFGAKAAYRGDKLTRRVWNEILAGSYIAQALIPPSERAIEVDGTPTHLKFDLRAYTYNGRIQLLAARMYSGQTTNFRTPGGGFAAVAVLPW